MQNKQNWNHSIIIDTGSSTTKAGFSQDLYPRVEIPTQLPNVDPSDATSSGEIMRRGILVNFDKLTRLWSHIIYDKLGVNNPQDHVLYFTEKPLNPKANREKTFQILFEEFDFAAVSYSRNSACALFGAGMLTGTLLDLGGGCSTIIPVYDGYTLPHAVQMLHMSGDDITTYLARMLSQSGQLTEPFNNDIARNIKESVAYISVNPDSEDTALPHNYTLPDGRVVAIGRERHRCTDSLFSPSLFGNEAVGIHQAISCSYQRLNNDIIPLFRNLILAGGTSLLPGLQERLQKELTLLQPCVNFSYTSLPNRKHLAWYGASLLTSQSIFLLSDGTHTKDEYDESGPSLVHRKIY